MFKPVRIVATIVFLAMIGLIFVGAFVIKIDVSVPYDRLMFLTTDLRFARFTSQFLCLSECLLIPAAAQLVTHPLISLCDSRISGLYVVYTLLHPIRENGSAQVFWNVIKFISAPEDFFALMSTPQCSSCFPRVVDRCMFSARLHLVTVCEDRCVICASRI